jgi:hypothetical protein
VRIDALATDHTAANSLAIRITPEGDLGVDVSEPAAIEKEERATVQAASPPACSDDYSIPFYHEENTSYEWYIGDGGMPGALSRDDAKVAFTDAINNITGGYNDCGIADTIDAKSTYKGTTTNEADVSSSSVCTDRDGKSTWDAGDLLAKHTAATCAWTRTVENNLDDVIEADVRYNTTDYDFTNNPTSSCNNKYDLRSTGTHEAGHVFGLGHTPYDGHDYLTMAPAAIPCSIVHRTLGLGDMSILEAIY